MKGELVFVGLSGGVDSSVAAKRLLERGYEVVGVFIKTWHPDFIACTEEQDRLDAMRVAAHLNIPFLTCDAEMEYKQDVADYMIREYRAGRTPNPDVMCNKYVKFGAFLNFAKGHGAAYVATGHYAQIEELHGVPTLTRGVDAEKDQSYFLWTLTPQELKHILFPIGDTRKSEIRDEAQRAGLPTSTKKDSQGICFLGKVDMESFLSAYITPMKGNVQTQDGLVIGSHNGAYFYTIGQRHGFEITHTTPETKNYYIVAKDIDTNTLTVSTQKPYVDGATIELGELTVTLTTGARYEAEFRYHQKPCAIEVVDVTAQSARIHVVDNGVDLPSLGQSCVLYQGKYCLGGGIITAFHKHEGGSGILSKV